MTDRVFLSGNGQLYDAAQAALSGREGGLADLPPAGMATVAGSLLVTVTDSCDPAGRAAVRDTARARQLVWLPVYTELSQVVIGPRERPGSPGCGECAELRRHRLRPHQAGYAAVWQRHQGPLANTPPGRLTGLAARLVAAILAHEIAADRPRTWRALLLVSLADLAVTRHPFLPEPTCPSCGNLPQDGPEAARLRLAPTLSHRPGSYRARAAGAELPQLTARYVDDQVGVVHSVSEGRAGALVTATARVGLRSGGDEVGIGRTSSSRASRLAALMEALERLGSYPAARRTAVTGSYRDLAGRALDPRRLGLHEPAQYALPGFPFRPFDVDQTYRWVWGWSFARAEPILVPERYGYYGADIGGHGFGYEISNGCALGGSLVEAILYGLLEVAERDAFLLTWYGRLSAPRIELAGARARLRLLRAAIAADSGYLVQLFDITAEPGIPCVWAMAANPNPTDDRPALVCAAGAHLGAEQAAASALAELSAHLPALTARYAQPGQADRAKAMVADPTLVKSMDDHPLLYCHPAAAGRLEFLTKSPARRPISQVGDPDPSWLAGDDLREHLLAAVARYTRDGLDVVVVDQTTCEHHASQLACVKVIIPGTLPMTFGHHFRRLHGLSRLARVPQQLGYRARRLSAAELNPDPHPFP